MEDWLLASWCAEHTKWTYRESPLHSPAAEWYRHLEDGEVALAVMQLQIRPTGGSGAADRKGRGVRRDPGMQSLQRWPEAEVDPLHGGGVSSGDSGRGRDEAAVARRERDEWIGGRRRLGRKRLGRERTGWVWDWEGERDFFPFSLFIIFPFYFFSSNYIYYIIKSIISIRDSKWGGILKYMV
jgi:hypothetical protein